MRKKTFHAVFTQLYSEQVHIALLSDANFKKEHDFLAEYDQLSIAKTLNRKFGSVKIFSIY